MSSVIRDKFLQKALVKAYAARASLFHRGVAKSRMRVLFKAVDSLSAEPSEWKLGDLGISKTALATIRKSRAKPHTVFAHPDILIRKPGLVAYYRNLVAVSQKGMGQLGWPTARYERSAKARMTPEDASSICRTLNEIMSAVLEAMPDFALAVARDAAFAEIGTELQGTWANMIGKGAARTVEEILAGHIRDKSLGQPMGKGQYELKNGWKAVFGSEPDISFVDAKGVVRIAVEIKGSLDKAGAQTRYGEAKKSFAKILSKNPRCHTIYLASCFTDSVMTQIEADGQVRDVFNLTAILHDPAEQAMFLQKLFHVVNAP